jgi:hypothetical protein
MDGCAYCQLFDCCPAAANPLVGCPLADDGGYQARERAPKAMRDERTPGDRRRATRDVAARFLPRRGPSFR